MKDYDFGCLNDKEFEALSTDVLSVSLDTHIERFKPGKDKGIDGRFFSSPGHEVIIQCKHWLKSGLAALIRHLKNTEAAKVDALKPSRYIFVTSLPLSNNDKKQIQKILSPHILSEADVLGNEDINDLLSRYPAVEKRHYKLWISSTTVLQTILSNAIIGRSRYKLDEIIRESQLYVETENHQAALKKLDEVHSVIITGAPGIGKTTLAEQLCRYYSAKGFQLCYIENSLNEAEEAYSDAEEQIFYFDDFLGRNFLQALDRHEDSHVINFMRRVERDPKKRFILTSRSTILNQGKRLSDLYNINNIDRNEYEIKIDSLSPIEKANILYNHIWFGQLEDGYIDEIYKNKRYREIIKHHNFNPRLISFITDAHRLAQVDIKDYWEYVVNMLNNPADIWEYVFQAQIDDPALHIVVAIAIHGRPIHESVLKEVFNNFKSSIFSNAFSGQDFDRTMRLLNGALVNKNVYSRTNKVMYDLFNPSIADYVIAKFYGDEDYIIEILSNLQTVYSLYNYRDLFHSEVLSEKSYMYIANGLLDKIINDEIKVGSQYLLELFDIIITTIKVDDVLFNKVKSLLPRITESDNIRNDESLFSVYTWSINNKLLSPNAEAIVLCISKALDDWLVIDDFIALSLLIKHIEPDEGELSVLFAKKLIDYLCEEITTMAIDEGICTDCYELSDMHRFDSELNGFIDELIADIVIPLNSHEIDEVIDCCDHDDIINHNRESVDPGDYSSDDEPRYSTLKDSLADDAIDDLFDRS